MLSGWDASSNRERRDRWVELQRWSREWGFEELVPDDDELPESAIYRAEADSGGMARQFAIDYQQYHPPRPKPNKEDLSDYLRTLIDRWPEVAGETWAATSIPKRFTGSKGRRLLVHIAAESPFPFYGSGFSVLRASINAVIAPHAVDHVDAAIVARRRQR